MVSCYNNNCDFNSTVIAFSEPEISGETTVAEGDALDLVCNGSNSDLQPTLHWLSPAGEKISDSGQHQQDYGWAVHMCSHST